MKPTIKNLANLLIGKSAVSSLHTTNFKEDRAFVITEVKVERGLVSVKGKNTSWLTENVVEVFNVQENKETNIEVSDALDAVRKLIPATRTGCVNQDEFDKIRDRIVSKNDMHPVGSWYYVIVSPTVGFYFVKLLSGWVVLDNVKRIDGNSLQTDLLRHIFTLTYRDYSPNAMVGLDTPNMIKIKEARAYFWIPNQFVNPIIEEVKEYLRRFSSFPENKINAAASFVMSDEVNNIFNSTYDGLAVLYNNDFSKVLKKDIKATFLNKGLTSTQADFAVTLIKD